MTKKALIALIILMGVFSVVNSYAQKREISFDLGYGSTRLEPYGAELVRPFNQWDSPFYQVGCKYLITARDGLGSAFTGLTIDWKEYTNGPDRSAAYLKIPVGFHLNYGRNYGLILGGGFNTGILIHQDDDLSFRDFSFGFFLKGGPAVRISETYRIILAYQANFDITPVYIEPMVSPGGSHYEHVNKGYDGFILLSVCKIIEASGLK